MARIGVSSVEEISDNDETDKTAEEARFLEEIPNHIAALRTAADWPKDVDSPPYRDEASIVYLNVLSKNISKFLPRSYKIEFILPHPLSMNRSVCYLCADGTTKEQQKEITQRFRNLGVRGKIKIIPRRLLENTVNDKDHNALMKLAFLYDSHIACSETYGLALKTKSDFDALYKVWVQVEDDNLRFAFLRTTLWKNSSENGYIGKVGHAGLTNKQLRENIESAVKYIDKYEKLAFPLGRICVKSMQLETGTSTGLTIYRDDSGITGGKQERFRKLPNKMIADSIALLKASVDWPTEAQLPAFGDEENTVYLNFIPKKMSKSFKAHNTIIITLRYELSRDRRVLFICSNDDTEEEMDEILHRLRNQGILGEIKIVPKRTVELVLKYRDKAALAELVNFDMHLMVEDEHKNEEMLHELLIDSLGKKRKFVTTVDNRIEINLLSTSLWRNLSQKGYSMKVGHTGHTDQELLKNIAESIRVIKNRGWVFKKGLEDIHLLQLQKGSSKGLTFYKADRSANQVPKEEEDAGCSLSTQVIVQGIETLMAAADWSKETTAPAFSGEDATVYLSILHKKIINVQWETRCGYIELPHPLSMDRNVCYIGRNVDCLDNLTQITPRLRKQGVLGAIEIAQLSAVETMLIEDDVDGLVELAKPHDMLLLDVENECLIPKMEHLLGAERAIVMAVTNYQIDPTKTIVWLNNSKNGFYLKVGHTGLTQQELQENIAAVVNWFEKRGDMFSNGLHDMKEILVKTGTTEGVVIHRGDCVEEVLVKDELKPAFPTKVIADSIAALKAAADWPKEAKFDDDVATLILHFVPKTMFTRKNGRVCKVINLPHSLSLDRSLCYISKNELIEEHQADVMRKLRRAGVSGKIKIVPLSLVELASKNRDFRGLDELARLYDTHLLDFNAHLAFPKEARIALAKRHKLCTNSFNLETALSETVMWQNVANTARFVKVGYTGLTDKQIEENIAAVVRYIEEKREQAFPDGLASVKSILLSTGTMEGVFIYPEKKVRRAKPEPNNADPEISANSDREVSLNSSPEVAADSSAEAAPFTVLPAAKKRKINSEPTCETAPLSAKKRKGLSQKNADLEITTLSAKKNVAPEAHPETGPRSVLEVDTITSSVTAHCTAKKQKNVDSEPTFESTSLSAKRGKVVKLNNAAPESTSLPAKRGKVVKLNNETPESTSLPVKRGKVVKLNNAAPESTSLPAKRGKVVKLTNETPESTSLSSKRGKVLKLNNAAPESTSLPVKRGKVVKLTNETPESTSLPAKRGKVVKLTIETPEFTSLSAKRGKVVKLNNAAPESTSLPAKRGKVVKLTNAAPESTSLPAKKVKVVKLNNAAPESTSLSAKKRKGVIITNASNTAPISTKKGDCTNRPN